jgi:hypothetical protein
MSKNKYVGKWLEETSNIIQEEFTYELLKKYINEIINKSFQYTEKDFKDWCDRSWMKFMDKSIEDNFLEKALSIAADIECQWDLYLVNSYNSSELQEINFNEIKLPQSYYLDWLNKLN